MLVESGEKYSAAAGAEIDSDVERVTHKETRVLLCVSLCISVSSVSLWFFFLKHLLTTETQRTQRSTEKKLKGLRQSSLDNSGTGNAFFAGTLCGFATPIAALSIRVQRIDGAAGSLARNSQNR